MGRVFLTAVLCAVVVVADVELTRTVDSVGSGVSVDVVLDHGCSSTDAYGSNVSPAPKIRRAWSRCLSRC